MDTDNSPSKLDFWCIIGFALLALGVQDLLAWAQIISVKFGWLMTVTNSDAFEPVSGLVLAIAGIALLGGTCLSLFSIRDLERKRARVTTLMAAAVAGMAGLAALQCLVPSTEILPLAGKGAALARASRQGALLSLLICAAGIAAFIVLRRKDAGFCKLSIPIARSNEIWRLKFKVELAIRAVPKNDEACRLIAHRLDFIQSKVGAQFDDFCEPLIKESADLSTIDNTARLQMDVGHVFKRYADFHRRLAGMRHALCEDLIKASYEAVTHLLENELPGQSLRIGPDDGVKVSISHPVLSDSLALQERRAEWDETLRTVVSIGAEKGNQIIGDWLQKAANGEVSAEEVPVAVEALRALCHRNDGHSGSMRDSKLLVLGA